MRATARVEGPEGQVVELTPGDLVGRSERAALRLDDPRVSEAHAWVSLRGGSLKLLALRGGMAVARRRVTEVDLAAGLSVHLARGVALHVLEVSLPSTLLAVAVDGGPAQTLTGSVQCVADAPPRLCAGFRDDALAHLWFTGAQWMMRTGADSAAVVPGAELQLEGCLLRFSEVDLEGAGAKSTVDAGKLHPSLHIVARYHSVHLHRPGQPVVSLAGQPAMLMSELVAMDGPVDWAVLAKQVWRRHSNREALRKKLDAALLRLRKKLAAHGIRDDLVRADGTGQIELVRYEGDRVEDLT